MVFAAGVLFGTLGLKILGSLDAKKLYTYIVAACLRGNNYVMRNVVNLQENAADIVAEAKEMNETRNQGEVVEDRSQETAK